MLGLGWVDFLLCDAALVPALDEVPHLSEGEGGEVDGWPPGCEGGGDGTDEGAYAAGDDDDALGVAEACDDGGDAFAKCGVGDFVEAVEQEQESPRAEGGVDVRGEAVEEDVFVVGEQEAPEAVEGEAVVVDGPGGVGTERGEEREGEADVPAGEVGDGEVVGLRAGEDEGEVAQDGAFAAAGAAE